MNKRDRNIAIAVFLMALCALGSSSCEKPSPTPGNLQTSGSLAPLLQITPRGLIKAGSPMTWTIVYNVAPEGVASGGVIVVAFLHPYYNNRPANMLPQIDDPRLPGFCLATINGEPVELRYRDTPLKPRTLELRAGDQGFVANDKVVIIMGIGPQGEPTMEAPKFVVEKFAPLVLIDQKGDGVFKRLFPGQQDFITVAAAEAVSAQVVTPSILSVGESFDLTLRFFDIHRNPAKPPKPVEVKFSAAGLKKGGETMGDAIYLSPPAPLVNWEWAKVRGGSFKAAGYYQLHADFGGVFSAAVSNPIHVTGDKSPKRIYFGDIHGHTLISDGLNSPEYFYDIAQGPAALSFAAVTDHEWQIDPAEWAGLTKLCAERNKPGDFVALAAWEFSFGGHGIVYYDRCDAVPEMPPDGPRELWQILFNDAWPYAWVKSGGAFMRGWGDKTLLAKTLLERGAMFIPHTSATMGMGNDWESFDPTKTYAVEIYSSHGCNESANNQRRVEPFAEFGSVQTALDRNFRTGFIAASDAHDSRPGLSTWGKYPGGLTAIKAGALTQRTVFDAIQGGRAYATTGARIILSVSLSGHRPGKIFIPEAEPVMEWEAAGQADIQRVEIVKNGLVVYDELVEGRSLTSARVAQGRWTDEQFEKPAYYYFRLTQVDGQQAWFSPFYAHHPSWALVKDFHVENTGMGVEAAWETENGLGTINFGLYKRLGDSGGGELHNYTAVGPEELPAGKFVFSDVDPLETGVTAYYILEERNDFGTRHIGPLATHSTLPVEPLYEGRWKLGYYANARGQARISVRDIDGQVVRVLVEGEKGPGYHQRIWDGKDDQGHKVKKLCFFQAEAAGIVSPQKAIINMVAAPDAQGQ